MYSKKIGKNETKLSESKSNGVTKSGQDWTGLLWVPTEIGAREGGGGGLVGGGVKAHRSSSGEQNSSQLLADKRRRHCARRG